MASPTGLIGGPTLNGEDLGEAALAALEVRVRDVGRAVIENATGDLRQGLHYVGAGCELVKRKYDHILQYNNLSAAMLDLVEELLAGPGPHELVSWKMVHLKFAGNGSRKEFTLPRYVANHFYTPPTILPEARFEPAIKVESTELTVSAEETATFEAGYPSAGLGWFHNEGLAIRVPTAPASGEFVYVRYCPIFSTFAADQTSKQYQGANPMREPRDIELRER
jgi:hypothetical protein